MGYGMRPRIFQWVILCLATALLLCALRLLPTYRGWTFSYGFNTSVLCPGDVAVVVDGGEGHLDGNLVGSTCAVLLDLTDTDSAYPHREISVKFLDGPWVNRCVTLERCQVRLK
jgi:hypothetical protein